MYIATDALGEVFLPRHPSYHFNVCLVATAATTAAVVLLVPMVFVIMTAATATAAATLMTTEESLDLLRRSLMDIVDLPDEVELLTR